MADLDVMKLEGFAERLQADPTPTSAAENVIGYLRMQLGADHVSITVVRSDLELETIASSSPMAEELNRLQYELGEGPCYDSSWHGETRIAPQLADDTRWPSWRPRASALGLNSILTTELPTGEGRRLGSLNNYWNHPRRFAPDDATFVKIVARHAVRALTAWNDAQLSLALDSRKVLGQAQGVLMERHNLDEDRAYGLLHRYAQDHQLDLHDVATHLIRARRLPLPDNSSE